MQMLKIYLKNLLFFYVKDLTDLQIELQILKIYFNVFIKNLFEKSTFSLLVYIWFSAKSVILVHENFLIFKIIKDYFQ